MYNKFYQKLLLLLHFLFCFFYTYRTAAKETGMCALLEGERGNQTCCMPRPGAHIACNGDRFATLRRTAIRLATTHTIGWCVCKVHIL